MDHHFAWINPPPDWSGDAIALDLVTGEQTDYWRRTFYGFTHDNGHAWVAPVAGDFSLSARFRGSYSALYDQAGLMVFGNGEAWVKAGIEFTDGAMHLSVVVSHPLSDWSMTPLPDAGPDTAIALRLTRHDDAVRVQYSLADDGWQMARLAPFPAGPAQAGVMACSPSRSGFKARFEDIAIGPAIPRELHED